MSFFREVLMKIDHITLMVNDIEQTSRFYAEVLNMRVVVYRDKSRSLHFGDQKIDLIEKGVEGNVSARYRVPGAAEICLVTYIPLEHVIRHSKEFGATILEGPVRRMGASGPIDSIYIYDPDGNLVEISNYIE